MKKRFTLRNGYIREYTAWGLDSTKFFAKNAYQATVLSPKLKRLERIKNYPFLNFFENGLPRNFHAFSDQLGVVEPINVAAHAGEHVPVKMSLCVVGEQNLTLSLHDTPDWLITSEFNKEFSAGVHEITMLIKLPPGVSQRIFHLVGPDQNVYDIRLIMRGYDLTEADFTKGTNDTELKYFDASNREKLFIRLESTEKLMNLYQGKKLQFRLPVGRQIDQIPVYQIPPGEYRMEVIDLGTGVKRSYGLKR